MVTNSGTKSTYVVSNSTAEFSSIESRRRLRCELDIRYDLQQKYEKNT